MFLFIEELLHTRRLNRWRRCRKLKHITEERIYRLEQIRAADIADGEDDVSALDKQISNLRVNLTSINNTLERLEKKERNRVSA